MKQLKCASCGNWNSAEAVVCSSCATPISDSYAKEQEERLVFERNPLPIMDVPEDASFFEKLWKKPLQWGQLIFLSILSIIAAFASSTVH
jgi:uncharacterized membrane protein YvbJ